ncbi:alpha/beta fold hydrolase [Georgenia ruanii]|uniref:Alpha/beta fold hydrolase n=1 Tax=Georgenia ruanii TaxID=348442 RepID=A0A7J9UUX3_9MICO|nr:alpha/beta hydrolase [Georgenia ruanii]MPV88408.1 alpha/beta fold hydrolase [Georgenia ruanii]
MSSARFLAVGGHQFGYLLADGPRASVPVVLLHALGETSASWADFVPRCAEAADVYALDLRGHGRSAWSGRYALSVMAADVIAFLDALGLGRVDLVGHSLGGLVACLAASAAPDRVRKLVLEDVPMPYPREPGSLVRPEGELDFDWEMVGELRAELDTPTPEWPSLLAKVQADTLVLGGGPSSHLPQEHVRGMAATIPGARFVEIGGGHMVHAAKPDDFAAAVLGHLRRGR